MVDATVLLNGVNGADGGYLTPELSIEQVARLARGEKLDAEHFEELRHRHESAVESFGVAFGIDPQDLAQAGWGVVFAYGADAAVLDALKPLLDHRRAQAGDRYKEYGGVAGYRSGDTARAWLARDPRKKAPGPVDPRKVPYYLLLVGDPEAMPFRFQYELDVNYAVGRIHFDTLAEYERYASSVVAAEEDSLDRAPRRATFFGVRNKADRATQLSADHLVKPLTAALSAGNGDSWKIETYLADDAAKAKLKGLLATADPPTILFTASHGMGFPKGDARQAAHQGALLCQDWPGPLGHRGQIPPEFYFSADDLTDDACLSGLVAFHFACYGAGTPRWDDYAHRDGQRLEIAPSAFMARLPQRALSLPKGGALAVVGHVERAWTYSFAWPGTNEELTVFQSTLEALMAGSRLGAAMEYFGMKYADLAVGLSSELEQIKFGAVPDDLELGNLWTANNDSRSCVIVGDPAVRAVCPERNGTARDTPAATAASSRNEPRRITGP